MNSDLATLDLSSSVIVVYRGVQLTIDKGAGGSVVGNGANAISVRQTGSVVVTADVDGQITVGPATADWPNAATVLDVASGGAVYDETTRVGTFDLAAAEAAFENGRNTDPGVANVLAPVAWKFKNAANNRTGTLVAGSGGGGGALEV